MSHSTWLGWLALDTRVQVELSSKGEKKKIKVTEGQCDQPWKSCRQDYELLDGFHGSRPDSWGQILRKSSPGIGKPSSIRRLQIKFSLLAAHSIVLAWRIPGTGEPGGLQSMGSHKVRQTEAT